MRMLNDNFAEGKQPDKVAGSSKITYPERNNQNTSIAGMKFKQKKICY